MDKVVTDALWLYLAAGRACLDQTNLTSRWASAQRDAGWHLLPIYTGTQLVVTASTT